jgi:hypothetical protein
MDRGNTSDSYDTWDPNRVQQTLLLLKHLRANPKLSTLLRIGSLVQLQSALPSRSRMLERHTSIFRVDGYFLRVSLLIKAEIPVKHLTSQIFESTPS